MRFIAELIKAIGRAFRGPVPAPRPVPAPAPPRPAPPQPRPSPTPPRNPQPAPPRPVPPPRGGETDTQPETQPETETTPDGQTETEGATKLEDDPQCETCPDCAARDMGSPVVEDIHGPNEAPRSRATKLNAAAYQHFVCPWHLYVPSANQIGGWQFSGVKFDGLHPTECHLYEAKHGYDGFLEQKDWSAQGGPQLRRWAEAAEVDVFERMVDQGGRQHRAVAPHFGEVELSWVFSHMITRLYVGRLLLDGVEGWYHEMEVRPWTSG
ncbi:MAG: Tox-REase-5 domain-containing protein [Pseudomonadota bacterium]